MDFSYLTTYQGSCGQEKSGFGYPEIKTNNDFDISEENGCQVGIFVFFAIWKSILVKNGLTFITVILFNIFSK